MPETVREQILSALVARLAPLSTAPVLRCQRPDLSTDPDARHIAVWDQSESTEDSAFDIERIRMIVEIHVVQQGANPSRLINESIGLVRQTVMLAGETTFGGLAESTYYTGAALSWSDQNGLEVGANLQFTIVYSTPTDDPYSVAD